MAKTNHYKAIICIEKRIEELNKEITLTAKIIDAPEMQSDYEFAKSDLDNFNQEIDQLKETIEILTPKI